MKALRTERETAIRLRKKGASYRDILKEIKVAKSSLSLWLKDLPLTKSEKYALKKRKNSNISRGRIKAAGVLSQRRLDREAVWLNEAREVFLSNKQEVFFAVGITLYWAEGSKRSTQWSFINSDEVMIKSMIDWILKYTAYKREHVQLRLFMHKLYAYESCEDWWAKELTISKSQFLKTIYKPSGRGIKKRPQYKGCIRIELRRSKELLMKMKFWQSMLVEYCKKQ